ncbi:hypothetical protein RB195_010342 [Necator americanus]|uniref:Uncharacterized protein n=1 Tax=Necator americanus TaxID=51031 RepID=A0ABR1CXH9_NECAM
MPLTVVFIFADILEGSCWQEEPITEDVPLTCFHNTVRLRIHWQITNECRGLGDSTAMNLQLFHFYLLSAIYVTQQYLPHCSSRSVMEGTVREYNGGEVMRIRSSIQVAMILHQTACFKLQVMNSSYTALYAIHFSKLEQHHPVLGKYIFGIPLVHTSCFCDCAGGAKACTIEDYRYRKCDGGAVCYRTYHSQQSNVGCRSNEKAEACCNIRMDIHENRTYEALSLNQPNTIATMVFSVYEWTEEEWKQSLKETIAVSLNRGFAQMGRSGRHKLQMSITSSRAFRELQFGMYYVERGLRSGEPDVYGYVQLNSIGESSLQKLGWLQFTEGRWDIRKGFIRVQRGNHVHFNSCAAQSYTILFDAEYLVHHFNSADDKHYQPGESRTVLSSAFKTAISGIGMHK